jgi:hypothetical protein
MGGAMQVHYLAAWHVNIDVQKINGFADESYSIPVDFVIVIIFISAFGALNGLAFLPDARSLR